MKRVTVAPRTPGWHELRAESWTASTAAVLVVKENAILLRDYAATKGITLDIGPLLDVGLESFYGNTLWKSWAEKMGRIPRFEGNAHTERGTAHEELVIQKFEADQLLAVEREVTALSTTHPGLLASFDAMAPASSDPSVFAPFGFPVEAKCPAFGSRKKLFESLAAINKPDRADAAILARKAAWEARGGTWGAIMGLPYYWCQVQHQILVAESPYGWFVAAGVEKDADGVEKLVYPLVEKVPRDDAFLRAYTAAANFYYQEFVDGCIEPPRLPSDDELLAKLAEKAAFERAIHDADHVTAVDLYLEAVKAEEAAVKLRKELEEKILAAAATLRVEGTDSVTLADRMLVTYSTSKSVSWQKVAKELAKTAGLSEIPQSVITACESKPKESVKLREVA